MAVLVFNTIQTMIFDRLQAPEPGGVDSPFTSAQSARHINEAYRDIWEIAGGQMVRAAHATLWATDVTLPAAGFLTSALTSIAAFEHVFASTVIGSIGEMVTNADTKLDPVEEDEIHYMRQNQTLFGSYARPKMYCVNRNHTVTPADVNKLRIDVWPVPSGTWYIPAHYVPQFTDIDSSTTTTPALNDLESSLIPLLAAKRMAPLAGRVEFVPGIDADLALRIEATGNRKFEALMHARQEAQGG